MKNLKKIFIQFIKFLFISGTGWVIDFGLYLILTGIFNLKILYSNILSSIPAITFVFIVSTKKIFKENKKGFSIKQKYIIYFLYQMILIFFISSLAQILYILAIKNNINFSSLKLIIKLLITPITMILNFFVIKYLAEKL
ncbi:GtrA family protein [Leptotrichia trevisanii]|uniref:GtrA family protein n=1 Tax=Leptotrichia trevisanii TaxID=109328 RepID=UPI00047D0189|nr:GtrA family protein [Leptotrichia trevisanii]